MSDTEGVDPDLQASLEQAAENANLPDTNVPVTSGDLEEGAAESRTEAGSRYDDMTGEQMKDELRTRTDDEGNALKVSGTVDELRQRLVDADAGRFDR